MPLVLDVVTQSLGQSDQAEPAMQRCTACKRDLPLESFRRNRRAPLGRMGQCKDCKRAYDLEYNSRPERKASERERTRTPEARVRQRERDAARNRTRARLDWLNSKGKRRRALRKGVGAEIFTDAELFAAWDGAGYYTCYWCELPFTEDVILHRDHVIPLARGGAHAIANLVPACATCNTSKGAKDPYDFARELHPWLA